MLDPDGIYQEFSARCTTCSFVAKFIEAMSVGYRVGDPVIKGIQDETRGRCNVCKTYTLVITAVPPPPAPSLPQDSGRSRDH